EDGGGSAAVGTMRHNDVVRGEANARIVFLDRGVLPVLDFSHVDSRQRGPAQLQRALQFGKVVSDAHRSGAFRDLDHGRHFLQLLVIECSIRGSEIHQSLLKLLNASPAADGLIVDLHAGMAALEPGNPPRHRRIDERAAGSNDAALIGSLWQIAVPGTRAGFRPGTATCRCQYDHRSDSKHPLTKVRSTPRHTRLLCRGTFFVFCGAMPLLNVPDGLLGSN